MPGPPPPSESIRRLRTPHRLGHLRVARRLGCLHGRLLGLRFRDRSRGEKQRIQRSELLKDGRGFLQITYKLASYFFTTWQPHVASRAILYEFAPACILCVPRYHDLQLVVWIYTSRTTCCIAGAISSMFFYVFVYELFMWLLGLTI
jgi:hypothetical protein